MDIIRRNTDYTLRAMLYLAARYGQGPVSARQIADTQDFSHALACKLLQKLQQAGLVRSSMGSKGGFVLCRKPENIFLREVVTTIQGPLTLSSCLLGKISCGRFDECPLRKNLGNLQESIDGYLARTSLADMIHDKE